MESKLQKNVPKYYMVTSFVADEEKSRIEIKTAMAAFGLLLKECSALVVWRISETVGYDDQRGLIVAYGSDEEALYQVFVAPDGRNCVIETVDSIMRMESDMEWKEMEYTSLLVEGV
ncbi:hypothetical protein ONZ45_g18088 [Pleurotus djamor]|nr:hypothetical protein ONZ45_g18088 [Pleurotus djamor]